MELVFEANGVGQMPVKLKMIGECYVGKFNTKLIRVYRDKYGKFYVKVDYTYTQKRLNAEEIVRYLLNRLNNG